MSSSFKWNRQILPVTMAGIISLFPMAAQGHPHEFVEMQIDLQFDDLGRASGMRYTWLFDEFFTAYAVEPADKDGDGKPEQEGLNEVLAEILESINEISYFTRFDPAGPKVELSTHKPVAAAMQDRQLLITFEVAFKTAIDLKDSDLKYTVYDGEFYIAMNHSTDPDAVQLVNAPAGCGWKIDLPNPDKDLTAFASSLGKAQSGGLDLGASFAEWVTISCK